MLVYADKERTKDRPEPIIAMGTNDQYTTVDFGAMTKELVKAAKEADSSKTTDVFFNQEVDEIEKIGDKFKVTTTNGTVYTADFVVVNARCTFTLFSSQNGTWKTYGFIINGWIILYYKWNIFKW